MKRIILTSVAGFALLGVGLTSMAEGNSEKRGGHHAERMAELDTDGDGVITRGEVEASHIARFNETDANGDGTLTVDEITAHHEAKRAERKQRRHERMLEKTDTNGDGVISSEEFTADKMARYDRMDTDGDGIVSKEERESAHSGRGGRHKMHRGGDKAPAVQQ